MRESLVIGGVSQAVSCVIVWAVTWKDSDGIEWCMDLLHWQRVYRMVLATVPLNADQMRWSDLFHVVWMTICALPSRGQCWLKKGRSRLDQSEIPTYTYLRCMPFPVKVVTFVCARDDTLHVVPSSSFDPFCTPIASLLDA